MKEYNTRGLFVNQKIGSSAGENYWIFIRRS
jgi:hypothetical protein